MTFRITGLPLTQFQHLFGLSDEALASKGAKRYIANSKPGFPDRISMRDAELGETLLLLNYLHQPADTPYRATHAIFVSEAAKQTYDVEGEVPEVLRVRPISLRAYDDAHMMVTGVLAHGDDVEKEIKKLLTNPETSYIHAHNATRGCYAGLITRSKN